MTQPYVLLDQFGVLMNGVSQGHFALANGYIPRKIIVQAIMETNPTYTVLLQPTKGAQADVFSTASLTKWSSGLAGGAFVAAGQPTGDTLEVLSSDASDTTQTVTVYANTASLGNVLAYSCRLMGTTIVGLGSTAPYDYQSAAGSGNFYTVLGVEVSENHAGTITIQEASGNVDLITLATGTNSVGVTNVAVGSQSAYGLPVLYDNSGTGTNIVGVYGMPSDFDGTYGEAVAHNGTTAVYGLRRWKYVSKLLYGDVASNRNAIFGQYGLTLPSGGGAMLTDKGAYEATLSGQNYVCWASYSDATLTAAGAADRLLIEVYG